MDCSLIFKNLTHSHKTNPHQHFHNLIYLNEAKELLSSSNWLHENRKAKTFLGNITLGETVGNFSHVDLTINSK